MKYIPVMGLEIHAELLTKSKVFCSCENKFGGEANSRVCPVCSGMPGTLPILNRDAVNLAVRAGLALNCRINNYSAFDRKNYYYPDLPKAYQITQFLYPICIGGYIEIFGQRIGIERIHIEEDAGKLTHYDGFSAIDYNRCGVPLIEIVTRPDFRSIEQVQEFVRQTALKLKYAEVCDARLEQGSLRVDVNISVMPEGAAEFGVRAEIKNLNSMKAIGRAIEFEIKRQSEILSEGGQVAQETRRYDDIKESTSPLRSKEEAHDYRYFPEPDIPPIFISDDEIGKIRKSMPEMPDRRANRYREWGLPDCDIELLTANRAFSDFYDAAAAECGEYKEVSNLMLGALNRLLKESGKAIAEVKFTPQSLAELAQMSAAEKVSKNSAAEILSEMFKSGKGPLEIAKDRDMILNDDRRAIEEEAVRVILENEKAAEQYRHGKTKALGFLMGRMMQNMKKSSNPKLCREILIEKLESD